MSQNVVGSSISWKIPQWFQELDSVILDLLKAYNDDLLKWTKSINLISPGTIPHIDRIHFSDSILGCQIISSSVTENAKVFDLGSGNGFPGVVFAILKSHIKVVCVDSDERKIGFLKQFGIRQGMKNLETSCRRIEDLENDSIEVAMARGLSALDKLLLLTEKKIKKDGCLFHFKGQEWKEEVNKLSEKAHLAWKTDLFGQYTLPLGSDGEMIQRFILKSTRL